LNAAAETIAPLTPDNVTLLQFQFLHFLHTPLSQNAIYKLDKAFIITYILLVVVVAEANFLLKLIH
jgi:hypothetical protein